MSDSNAAIEKIANREYEYGFVTDIEDGPFIPPGPRPRRSSASSPSKKHEPGVAARVALEGAEDASMEMLAGGEPPSRRWAMVSYPEIDYQDMSTTRRPSSRRSSRASTRSTPSC